MVLELRPQITPPLTNGPLSRQSHVAVAQCARTVSTSTFPARSVLDERAQRVLNDCARNVFNAPNLLKTNFFPLVPSRHRQLRINHLEPPKLEPKYSGNPWNRHFRTTRKPPGPGGNQTWRRPPPSKKRLSPPDGMQSGGHRLMVCKAVVTAKGKQQRRWSPPDGVQKAVVTA
jgi:hypothetical protein